MDYSTTLLKAFVDELMKPPRVGVRAVFAWYFLYPLVESLTRPLQSVRVFMALGALLLLFRLAQLIRLCTEVTGKAVPRAVRTDLETAARRVSTACRTGAAGALLLVFVSLPLGVAWVLWGCAGAALETLGPHSAVARRVAGLVGVSVASSALPSEAGASGGSAAAREKPARHKTNRYEVIDEGAHFGRVARGSLCQNASA
jgi:hypothetical protein